MFASRHSMLTSSLSFVKVCLLVCDCALGLGVVGVRLGVRLGADSPFPILLLSWPFVFR